MGDITDGISYVMIITRGDTKSTFKGDTCIIGTVIENYTV